MKMRLIDADALLEKYNLKDATKYGNKNAEQQRHSYDTMMMYEIADMIEDAPTAYDVDKVVEQLEETSIEELGINRAQFRMDEGEYSTYCSLSLYDAKKIVRAGGID